jgi:hypothetical protein
MPQVVEKTENRTRCMEALERRTVLAKEGTKAGENGAVHG